MEGEIRGSSLVDALQAVGNQSKTGILTVQGSDEIIALSFLAGSIVGADALNQSLEEGLGEVLSSQQLVDPEEFGRLASEQEAGGGRVVDLLVERSFLSRSQLLASLRLHTYRLCLEALSWSSGEYRFYQGDEVAYEAGVQPLTVAELLSQAGEELGERGPTAAELPDSSETLQAAAGVEVSLLPDSVAGDEPEKALLQLLDGTRSLREAAAEAGLPEVDARQVAGKWMARGVVERVAPRSSLPEPAVDPAATLDPPLAEVEEDSLLALELSDVLDTSESVGAQPAQRARTAERRAGAGLEIVSRWFHRGLGLGILVASLSLLVTAPVRILLPFPWQGSQRLGLDSVGRSLERIEIENGARTFFLLHGRFPEHLGELAALDLIGKTAASGDWRLLAAPTTLVLQAGQGRGGVEEQSWTIAMAGDFQLDPGFFASGELAQGPLLVLLD